MVYQRQFWLLNRIGLARICLVITVLSLSGGIWLGSYLAPESQENRQLQNRLEQREETLARMETELAQLQPGAQVDKLSLKQVQGSLSELQLALAEAEQEVWLYRHLLQEKGEKSGGFNSTLRLLQADSSQQVSYQLLLYQNEAKAAKAKVNYLMVVKGIRDGVEASYTVPAADAGVGARKATFRYFHRENGEIVLPEGLDPIEVEVRAWLDGGPETMTTRAFPWVITGLEQ